MTQWKDEHSLAQQVATTTKSVRTKWTMNNELTLKKETPSQTKVQLLLLPMLVVERVLGKLVCVRPGDWMQVC